MGLRAVWSLETSDMFTAATGSPKQQQFLLVERLPSGGWDWVAWRCSDSERAVHGVAESAPAAMQAAECAAATLNAARAFFSTAHGRLLQQACARTN